MRLTPDWPSVLYRPFCSHPSTSTTSEKRPDGSWMQVEWACLRCGKTRNDGSAA